MSTATLTLEQRRVNLYLHIDPPESHVFEDSRNAVQRIGHGVLGCLRELFLDCTSLRYRCASIDFYDSLDDLPLWQEKSEGLFLFLHGFKGHPSIWNRQKKLLELHPEFDTFAPVIPSLGNCSLDDAGEPLLEVLLNYSDKHPGKPVCISGVSNGSRLATWLEVRMREQRPDTPIRISTISGVHYGTSMVDRLNRWGVADWILDEDFSREMAFGSPKARELLRKVKTALPDNVKPRSYQFFATTGDLVVDLESSIPRLGKDEEVTIVHGQGHGSLVPAIAAEQIESSVKWMKQQSSSKKQA